jgi:hypothetical protein
VECVLVVRAPRSMYTLWNLGVKRFLPERSISKVRIAGNDFESQLAEVRVRPVNICRAGARGTLLCTYGKAKAMLFKCDANPGSHCVVLDFELRNIFLSYHLSPSVCFAMCTLSLPNLLCSR